MAHLTELSSPDAAALRVLGDRDPSSTARPRSSALDSDIASESGLWGRHTCPMHLGANPAHPKYKDIVDVIDAAKGAGVEKVGIVTEGMRKAAGGV